MNFNKEQREALKHVNAYVESHMQEELTCENNVKHILQNIVENNSLPEIVNILKRIFHR